MPWAGVECVARPRIKSCRHCFDNTAVTAGVWDVHGLGVTPRDNLTAWFPESSRRRPGVTVCAHKKEAAQRTRERLSRRCTASASIQTRYFNAPR